MSCTRFARLILTLAVLLAWTASLGAQTPADGSGGLRVGVMNAQLALLETAEMKKAQAALEAKYKPRQSEIAQLQAEIANIQTQLQSLGDKLQPQAQQDMVADGQRKQRNLQRLQEDLESAVEFDRNDILNRGQERMREIVNKVAADKGLDMIVDATVLFFSKPAFDVTKDVTTAYDAAHPVTE
jgi:outer membrane protein